ncbi:hypothetical protein [uncultured Methanolobus sp.]|uniref:hypothetical protein n=1 Tax=uncultured Methanolobus sp. TaxID=218300 RepID=UPI002AAA8B0C|nr:hypothetical protein [uncultured Methanolobus sp.]
MAELKKKGITENASTQKTNSNTGSKHEHTAQSEEEGFYSSCGQAFIRIQKD